MQESGHTRLLGSEREYAFSVASAAGEADDPSYALHRLIAVMKSRFGGVPDGSQTGMFFPGAHRFMVDCGAHPEFSTAECTTPEQCVAAIAAGDRMVAAGVAEVSAELGRRGLQVFAGRGNIDYLGSSTWGSHDSFMFLGKETPWMTSQMIPYLVSRLVFTGTGGWDPGFGGLKFVLSSRALRFVDVVSVSSTDSRPIYHRRGEPLCRGFSRIHIILGEGQASHWGLYLRLASAALVLRLVEGGADFAATLALASPVEALHLISRDPTLRQRVKIADGRELTAIEIQRCYLERVETELSRGCLPPWASKACKRWRWTLDQLEHQPDRLAGVLDWPLKRKIFAKRLARHRLSIDDFADRGRSPFPIGGLNPPEFKAIRPQMLALDVQFGRLDDDGLFQQLDQAGLLDHHIPEVSDDTVTQAMRNPPEGSRATLRGRIVSQPDAARHFTVSWDHVVGQDGRVLDMSNPFATEEVWGPPASPNTESPENLLQRRARRVPDTREPAQSVLERFRRLRAEAAGRQDDQGSRNSG
jgi:proteasome accessory factor A